MNRLWNLHLFATMVLMTALSPFIAAASDRPFLPSDEKVISDHQRRLSEFATQLARHQLTANQYLYDARYYSIDLEINTVAETITGRVDIHGRSLTSPLDIIELDFYSLLVVDSILVRGVAASYMRGGNLLTVNYPGLQPDEDFVVTVFYRGTPGNQGFGAFSFARNLDIYVISTLSEPFFARSWWPCKDHPSDKADSVDVRVRVDSSLKVVSNGLLQSIINHGDGTSTTHWHESYPITTYLVSLAISDYDHYADTLRYNGKTMPVEFYIFRGFVDNYKATNDLVVPMLAFFSDLYGEYPFINEKYGHAQFLWGGGMEHQTCSSMGGFSDWLIAHELAHQWWGDMITCGTWHDIWLNEGFARYSEALWLEHTDGPDALVDYMSRLVNLDQQVYVEDTTYTYQIFDRVVYDKGAFVLHTLRYLTGDSTFFQILRTYYDSQHKYGTATTEDFRAIAEAVSGRDLERYFDQWVYQPHIPFYEFGYSTYSSDSGWVTFLEMRQTQDEPIFETDIDVAFICADTTITKRINNSRAREYYRFLLPQRPMNCVLDPRNWINNLSRPIELSLAAIDDSLPDAFAGEYYRYQLSAVGGTPPLTWSAFVVSLPEGLRLSQDGVLSGIPETAGAFEVGVRLIDSGNPETVGSTLLPLRVNQLHGNFDDLAPLRLNDLLLMINYLYRDGAAPAHPVQADADCDGSIDAADVVLLVNYLYRLGPRPCY